MNRLGVTLIAVATLTLLAGGVAQAHDQGPRLQARADDYRVTEGATLRVGGNGVLGNDKGSPVTLVAHSAPAHGSLTLTLNQDGSLRYTPAAGFTGTDSFTYTVSDAVRLYQTHVPPLATIGGVKVTPNFTLIPAGDRVQLVLSTHPTAFHVPLTPTAAQTTNLNYGTYTVQRSPQAASSVTLPLASASQFTASSINWGPTS